jgi:hypothetical protein
VRAFFQTLGVLIAAGFSVWLAISRFKKEKMWERRLSAYVDTITVLGSMLTVLGRKMDQSDISETYDDESKVTEDSEYRSLVRDFYNSIAISKVLLSENCSKLLSNLYLNLDRVAKQNPFEDSATRFSFIEDALVELIAEGKHELR